MNVLYVYSMLIIDMAVNLLVPPVPKPLHKKVGQFIPRFKDLILPHILPLGCLKPLAL